VSQISLRRIWPQGRPTADASRVPVRVCAGSFSPTSLFSASMVRTESGMLRRMSRTFRGSVEIGIRHLIARPWVPARCPVWSHEANPATQCRRASLPFSQCSYGLSIWQWDENAGRFAVQAARHVGLVVKARKTRSPRHKSAGRVSGEGPRRGRESAELEPADTHRGDNERRGSPATAPETRASGEANLP